MVFFAIMGLSAWGAVIIFTCQPASCHLVLNTDVTSLKQPSLTATVLGNCSGTTFLPRFKSVHKSFPPGILIAYLFIMSFLFAFLSASRISLHLAFGL